MRENNWLSSPLAKLIICTSAVRVLLASNLNLGNDEAYYFTYAVQPDWNHFDHPPLIGLFIRLSTLNLHWITGLSMRLPAIIGAAVSTWLIALCGKQLRSEHAGIYAALLYNTCIYTSIVSGLFILPDSVQLTFWLAALHQMLKMTESTQNAAKSKAVLSLGLWIGLAVMSKVHGAFLWAGFLGFAIFYQPQWQKNPWLYVSVALTAVIACPILYWNVANDFITWRFHAARVTADDGINLRSFGLTSIGQIAYANPFQFALHLLTLTAIHKKVNITSGNMQKLLLWCGLPIIAATTAVSLLRETLPHWSGPGYVALILLSGAYLDYQHEQKQTKVLYLLRASTALMALICIAGPILIKCYPGTLSEKPAPETGNGDFTLDLTGWEQLLPAFEKLRAKDIETGKISPDAPIVTGKWFPGGHLYFYLAYPLKIRFLGLGRLNDLHKFSWLNSNYGSIKPGSDAYYISPSNNFDDPNQLYGKDFKKIEMAAAVPQHRNGKIARYWYIYRLRYALSELAAKVEMPEREKTNQAEHKASQHIGQPVSAQVNP